MAKKSSRSQRGVSNTANPRLLATFSPFTPHPNQLNLFEDRRLFDPDPIPPARSFHTPRHRLVLPAPLQKPSVRGALPHALGFQAPNKVLICVRRKIRREVLHAYKRTRKGASSSRRRNYYSSISCK